MSKVKRGVLMANLVALLVYVAGFVTDKERTISGGTLVLLELAPTDPRSLLQGDYMILAYAIGWGLDRDKLPDRGFLILTLDENGVGQRQRLQSEPVPLAAGEVALSFRRRSAGAARVGPILIGAESYFFQEGAADRFGRARYGGLRVDDRGGSVLVGLWDEDFRRIE